MTDNAVHVAPMANPHAPKAESFGARHRRSFIVVTVIGLLMAILAPLQTNLIPFWERLVYWELLMLSGAVIGLGITEGIERWGKLKRWPWLEILVMGLLIALPLTMIVIGASNLFFGVSTPGVIRFSYNFGVTAVISIAITSLNHLLAAGRTASPPQPAGQPAFESVTQTPGRLAERLPLPLRNQSVIALQAEDHYLRVHFDNGQSTLILMRLTDAVADLPADLGAQTHRSWWVAKDAVRGVAKADGRATLSLDYGIQAPVSRSYYRLISEAGWLR